VMEILGMNLPQHAGYQVPFNQQKAAPENGIPAE